MKGLIVLLCLSWSWSLYGEDLSCSKDFESISPKIRVSSSISSAMVNHKVLPSMGDFGGNHLHISGTVIIDALVDKNGKVQCAVVRSGHPMLIQRSLEAASKWEFNPYLFNGKPVAIITDIRFIYADLKVSAE